MKLRPAILVFVLLAAPVATAAPIDTDEALGNYLYDGFTFPAVEQDRGSFYASYFMDHVVAGNCAADTNGDGCPDAYSPCTLRKDWACGIQRYENHQGTDFPNSSTPGLRMAAAEAGWVVHTRDGYADGDVGGLGNFVTIRHPGPDGIGWNDDDVFTYYGHQAGGSILGRAGTGPDDSDFVYCGQRIGEVGTSGNSTAIHIHFEVRLGGDTNPASG